MYVILLFWIFSAIWGNDFLKFNILGLNPFYLLVIYSFFYIFKYRYWDKWKKNIYWNRYKNYLNFFIIICIVYIIISTLNYTKIFNINILYKRSHILNQSYIIFFIPVIMFMISKINLNNKLEKILNSKIVYIIFIMLLFISKFYSRDYIPYRSLMFAIGTAIFIFKKNILSFFILVYTLITQLGYDDSSSIIVSVMVVMFISCFWKIVRVFLNKNFKIKYFIFFFIMPLLLVAIIISSSEIFINDHNSVWRINYWIHEIKLVFKTYFIGVGFGTSYGTLDIVNEINMIGMFLAQGSLVDGLFSITQHSSYINYFYRMGILGVYFFTILTIYPIKWCADKLKKLNDNKFIYWGLVNYIFNFVIILFNPGLESPRFAINFFFSIGILLGFLIKYGDLVIDES